MAGVHLDRAGGAGGHPPVVMLILDELPLVSLLGPDGRIDAARFPHFAELAAGSTWYRNATGVSGWTPYALPAMLTGRYPATGAAPHYSQHPDNLFTAFGGLYDIRAEESITASTVASTGAASTCISTSTSCPGSAQIRAVEATASGSGMPCAAASAPKPT